MLLMAITSGIALEWLRRGWQSEQSTIGLLGNTRAKFMFKPIGPEGIERVLGTRWSYLRDRMWGVHLDLLQREEIEELHLNSLRYVESFQCFGCGQRGKKLYRLGEWPNLKELLMYQCSIDEEFMSGLEKCPGLTRLDLQETFFPRDGLAHLATLRQLTFLSLSFTSMHDGGMHYLRGLVSLEELNLSGTGITDRGLEQLKELKSLRILNVQLTRVTPAGVAELQKGIPGLRVIAD